jgi:hypothetical protein
MRVEQLTKEQAIRFAASGAWESMSLMDRARFQLEQGKLCMPFEVFHAAVEHALGRPVWTHEFADPQTLRDELYERSPKATMAEVVAKIPQGKQVIIAKVRETGSEH